MSSRQPLSQSSSQPDVAVWALAEVVEAAVRVGLTHIAADALQRLEGSTADTASDWARGVESRSRAMLAVGAEADGFYREAIAYLGRSHVRADLARAQLLYGEWLRRENRRRDARTQLQLAVVLFETMHAANFAERAQRELDATGGIVVPRQETERRLTPQEAAIARLAGQGMTNAEIGRQDRRPTTPARVPDGTGRRARRLDRRAREMRVSVSRRTPTFQGSPPGLPKS
jgi:ATP/maltotriose-dependent transcriptional regulator MalT